MDRDQERLLTTVTGTHFPHNAGKHVLANFVQMNLPSPAVHQHYCSPTQAPGRDPTSSLKASTVLIKWQAVT